MTTFVVTKTFESLNGYSFSEVCASDCKETAYTEMTIVAQSTLVEMIAQSRTVKFSEPPRVTRSDDESIVIEDDCGRCVTFAVRKQEKKVPEED